MLRYVFFSVLALAALAVGSFAWFAYATCDLPAVGPAALPAAAGEDGLSEWGARTVRDLTAARQLLWDNTPIPYDAENPSYRAWLVSGYDEAVGRARTVKDFAGHFFTLAGYLNGFRDPHIAVSVVGDPPAGRWPGFIASAYGEGAKIAYRDEGDASVPPLGATILTCDGKAIGDLVRERVFPFRLNPAFGADRRAAVSRLFLDRGNPFAPAPTVCRMEIAGRTKDVSLGWRPLPSPDEAWFKLFSDAIAGPDASWGASEPAPGVTWIGVPTFSSGDETSAKLDALIKAVEARGAAMRNGRAIVIDTRGNGGGNSSWADRLAVAIFTQPVLDKFAAPDREQATDWRASASNSAYWTAWSEQMAKEFGVFSFNRAESMFLGWQLGRLKDHDPPIWRMGSCKPGKTGGFSKMRPKGRSPFPAQVYFLTNGSCGSSCLNFADRVLMVPGVQVIGMATSGDGMYMEVREEKLPSGLLELTLPQKVDRGGGRASMEVYDADVAYDGAWTDEAVRAWVMNLVSAP